MDEKQFDLLSRRVGGRMSRRMELQRLAGLAVMFGSFAAGPGETALATRKVKGQKTVTLCHEGQTIKVTRKKKSQHLRHGDALGPCSNPQLASCPEGQKSCQGRCIASNQ